MVIPCNLVSYIVLSFSRVCSYDLSMLNLPEVTKPVHEDFQVVADLSALPPGEWDVTVTAAEVETGLNHTANVSAAIQVTNS